MINKDTTNRDIKCAIEICNNLLHKESSELISKKEIGQLASTGKHTKATLNRAIRELIRLKIIHSVRASGYRINKDQISKARLKLSQLNKEYISLSEARKRLKPHQFLVRQELNELLPELSVQAIDEIILQLKEHGFISNYESNSRGKFIIDSNPEEVFFADLISKIANVYGDVIFCYNTALEYHNLSRYISSNVIYISGKTSHKTDQIFHKKIKNVNLKNSYLGIIEENTIQGNLRVTDIERTIIDAIRFPKYVLGWENIFHALKRVNPLDSNKIFDYLLQLQIPTLTSRVGVILEHFENQLNLDEYYLSRLSMYKNKTPFRMIRNNPGVLNKTWNVYIPINFFDYE